MLNELLPTLLKPVAVAVSEYPDPGLLMLSVEKVATPFTAVTVVVPDNAPLAGLEPITTVMLFVALVTVLPRLSCTATWTAGAIAVFDRASLGCTTNLRRVGVPVMMLKGTLVAPVSPVEAAV